MSDAALVESNRGVEVHRWPLTLGRSYIVGREGCGADIGVAHDSLSREHCSLCLEEGAGGELLLTITDLRSTNGTSVNGASLESGSASTMKYIPGQELSMGRCPSIFRVVADRPKRRQVTGDEEESHGTNRRGFAFDYSADDGTSRRPANRNRRIDEGRQQKRKALWANSKKPAPAAEQSGLEDQSLERSANDWESANFTSDSERNKFLKLMGAKAPADASKSGQTGIAGESGQDSSRQLEHEYWRGMRQHMQGRTRGLGAS